MTVNVIGNAPQQQYVGLTQSGQTPPQEPVAAGAAGNVGSLAEAARPDHVHPSGGLISLLWGNGSDGAAVLDGTNTFAWATKSGNVYTLTRAVFLTSLTVNSGVTLRTNNARGVWVSGTLQNNGIINNDGYAATGATANASAAVTFQAGGAGGAGNTGAGSAGAQPTGNPNVTFAGGGGPGGLGSSGAGGVGGSAQQLPSNKGLVAWDLLFALLGVTMSAASSTLQQISGGSGGGGGGGDSTNHGGAGGQGGGILMVFAQILTGNGVFSANGGRGGNASTGNCGGGGGGGNGLVIVNANVISGWTGTLSAAGGDGGTAVGTGVAGSAGLVANGTATYLNQWQ